MSRTVSAQIQTGLDAHITATSYLIELLLDTPIYLSTMDAVTWDGHAWLADAAKVERLAETGGRISLRNDDNSGSTLVLNNVTRDKVVVLYQYYNGDATEVFRGFIGDSNIDPMEVTMDVLASRSDLSVAPRGRIVEPVFTKILAPGVTIYWGNQTLRVQ